MNTTPNGIPFGITSDGKDIISSGTVLSFGRSDFTFKLANLKYEIKFINDSNGIRMENRTLNDVSIEIKLYNFINSLGTGTTSPILVGHLNNRSLYLGFMVHAQEPSGVKMLTYTFYMGDTYNA